MNSVILWHLSQTILSLATTQMYHKCNALGDKLNDAIGALK